jgi:glutamyl/glutaminyl-tRNA synthetase
MTDQTNVVVAPPAAEEEEETYTGAALSARELAWAVNSPALLQEQKAANGRIIRTRFPPEPNGYLHIGHAKSMNMNFRLAFDKLGVPEKHRRTIFRYDDTNPDAEATEYIDSIERDLKWLGWEPERTTYSSDNFQALYDLAVALIHKGLAYVCDMSKAEMEAQRELAMKRNNARNTGKDADSEAPIPGPHVLPGRNRDTSVARNLALFEKMKLGCFAEGTYTLRLKMDFQSSNPNMYDLVAYRIKYTAHPHAGASGWCIYPAYDFTHGICDSLERIDYSICTLEFESRRYVSFLCFMVVLCVSFCVVLVALLTHPLSGFVCLGIERTVNPSKCFSSRLAGAIHNLLGGATPMVHDTHTTVTLSVPLLSYWILWALDMYRPKVYEMSRLNLQYTVLSKRRLIKLVTSNFVRDWDDPRMPTVSGLRRRGYTRNIINQFCQDVGATRAANVVEIDKLYQTARVILSTSTCRVMACLEPIKVVIANFAEQSAGQAESMTFTVPNSATNESLGSHTITLTAILYIDASDFRLQDSKDYYGLAPKKAVGLKYQGGNLFCNEVIQEGDVIKELRCTLDSSSDRPKPQTYLSWVPADAVSAEVRVYDNLFTVPEPSDLWEDELNRNSEKVYPNALIDPSVKEFVDYRKVDKWTSNAALQFERVGYFVVDYETTFDPETGKGKIVFNRTVSLKEEAAIKKLSPEEEAKRLERAERTSRDLEAKKKRMEIEPKDFFKLFEEFQGKYSKFNEATGFPTHDIEGTELTKSAIKKLNKELVKHIKQQTAWKKNNAS